MICTHPSVYLVIGTRIDWLWTSHRWLCHHRYPHPRYEWQLTLVVLLLPFPLWQAILVTLGTRRKWSRGWREIRAGKPELKSVSFEMLTNVDWNEVDARNRQTKACDRFDTYFKPNSTEYKFSITRVPLVSDLPSQYANARPPMFKKN